MKIGLVIPPSPFLGAEKRNCPLGILYIAAVLEQDSRDVFVVDLRGIENWRTHLPPAEMYGITATTADYNSAVEIARYIKRVHGSWLVIGGSHVTALPSYTNKAFDDIVVGEGEIPMRLIGRNEYSGYGTCPYRVENLDNIPFPARHLLPRDSVISSGLSGDEPATTIIASRGCTHKCSFCSADMMWGRKIKYRSPGNVVSEIKHLIATYGIRSFRFHDDNITANAAYLFSLCEEIKPLNIQWRCSSRIDSILDKSMLQAMKDSGCTEIGWGVESVLQHTLDMNSKGVNTGQVLDVLLASNEVGIHNRLYLIIGLPGEEKGIADRTIEFLRKANTDCVMLSTFVPYPGTDIFINPDKYGVRIKHHDYSKYLSVVGFYEDERNIPFICGYEDFSEQELIDERAKIIDFIKAEGLDKAK